MKSLALIALIAVPRPAIEHLGARFTGWRKLFRAALRIIAFTLLIVCALSPLVFCFLGGTN